MIDERRRSFSEWRQSIETQRLKRHWLARFWFTIGVLGVLHSITGLGVAIEKSIPVLFFISVYANYISEKSTEQGYVVEAKQESAEADAHDVD